MTSDNRITNIIGQLGELRELLLVIDQSGEETPSILLKLARDKAEGILDVIDGLRSPEFWEEMNQLVLSEWNEEEEPVEEPVFEEDDLENLPEEEAVDDFEPEPDEDDEDDFFEEDDEDDFFDDDDDEEEDDFFGEEEEETSDAPENLTLDEALQRRRTKELRKALSLNDKFRFRRELFGNSDVRMTETLALIDAMDSYEEAEDYIFNDLGWDIENTEVAEFMKIVQNRFL